MTELQRYLAEEVAEDLEDGIITRREAMRRLGLMGITGAAATGLLAAAASPAAAAPKKKPAASKGTARGLGSTDDWAPVATQPITFAGPRGTLQAAWAPADGKVKGSVLVIHENRGLTDHIRNVAGRFAASGWSALALDLLSEEGGTASFPRRGGRLRRARRGHRPDALRQRHEGRRDRAAQARPAQADRRDRLLLRRRHDLAAARRQGAPARRRRAVLRPVPGGRGLQGHRAPRCSASTAGSTRRASTTGAPRQGGARRRSRQAPDPHVHRGQPRVLQRHGAALQRAGVAGGVVARAGLVRGRHKR